MNPFTLLMLLSAIGVVALFVALVIYLIRIDRALETIGGTGKRYGATASYLSRIRMGVRAIEVHTDSIAPRVTTLNEGLAAIRVGMEQIDRDLGGVIEAVSSQEVP
ncbi:hypothetical protein BH23GEM9_BH23GEM9_30330 [soil metagenome]